MSQAKTRAMHSIAAAVQERAGRRRRGTGAAAIDCPSHCRAPLKSQVEETASLCTVFANYVEAAKPSALAATLPVPGAAGEEGSTGGSTRAAPGQYQPSTSPAPPQTRRRPPRLPWSGSRSGRQRAHALAVSVWLLRAAAPLHVCTSLHLCTHLCTSARLRLCPRRPRCVGTRANAGRLAACLQRGWLPPPQLSTCISAGSRAAQWCSKARRGEAKTTARPREPFSSSSSSTHTHTHTHRQSPAQHRRKLQLNMPISISLSIRYSSRRCTRRVASLCLGSSRAAPSLHSQTMHTSPSRLVPSATRFMHCCRFASWSLHPSPRRLFSILLLIVPTRFLQSMLLLFLLLLHHFSCSSSPTAHLAYT